jgi:hypothetical protein
MLNLRMMEYFRITQFLDFAHRPEFGKWFKNQAIQIALHHRHSHFDSRRMPSSGMLRRVALVRTDVSEELSASFIRVTRIGELGITCKI